VVAGPVVLHLRPDARGLEALGGLEADERPVLDEHLPAAGAGLDDRELRELRSRVLDDEERAFHDRLVVVGAGDALALRADQGDLRRGVLTGGDDRRAREVVRQLDVLRPAYL